MKKKLGFSKQFLLSITHIVASSVLIEMTVGISALPSQAASLALSQSLAEFDNFSHPTLGVETSTNTNALAVAATDSSANALAEAEAFFLTDPTIAANYSYSTAFGEGNNYIGEAESQAQVIGNFFIDAGQTFSFDFTANLELVTSIDNAIEDASADGDLRFLLVDTADPNTVYDFFSISSQLSTPASNDFLDIQNSSNVTFDKSSNTNFGGTQEGALALTNGRLERLFTQSTSVTLIESKVNRANVRTVPEGPSMLASLFVLGFAGFRYSTRKKRLSVATFKVEPN